MSLVEVIMAIGIFVIGIAGFTALFASSWRSNSFVLEEGEASFKASRAVNSIIKDLRKVRQADNGAYPVQSGDGFNLTVFIDIDNDGVTERVHYFLDQANDLIKRGVTEPSVSPATYPSGDQTVTTVMDYVINSDAQPIFYYYNKNYPGDLANNPLATPVSVGEVRLVKVHLMVNINPLKAPDNINIESFAELRNINSYAF